MSLLLHDLCTDISRRMGTFVEEWGNIDHQGPSNIDAHARRKRQRIQPNEENEEEEEENEEEEVETEEEEVETEEEEESEEEEEDEGSKEDDDSDGEEHGDGNAAEQSKDSSQTTDHGNRDKYEQGCDREKVPRRSPRFVMSSPNKGWSNGSSQRLGDVRDLEMTEKLQRKSSRLVKINPAVGCSNDSRQMMEDREGGKGNDQACNQGKTPRRSPRFAMNSTIRT